MEDSAEQIVADFKREGWKTNPFERTIELRNRREEIHRLVNLVVSETPKGGTFHDAAISYLRMEDFPDVILHALKMLESHSHHEAAEAVISYASLQCPSALHPHLDLIFEINPNGSAYYADWPWRESGLRHFEYLSQVIEDKTCPPNTREKAWRALLETRDESALSYAAAKYAALRLQYPLNAYLNSVGYELSGETFRRLYSSACLHINFPEEYLSLCAKINNRATWERTHPTWQQKSEDAQTMRFGGKGQGECLVCGERLHHLITLDPIPDGIGITGLPAATFETCLSCLGLEKDTQYLYYQHDRGGIPHQIGYSGQKHLPQYPAAPLEEVRVRLAKTDPRWFWQDHALSNGRENLHRVGGFPGWIQSARHPQCPQCHRTMIFIFQIDSHLLAINGETWLWGDAGMGYVLWCNECQVSAHLLQCY